MIFTKEAISKRQEKAVKAFADLKQNVLVYSGEPIGKPGGLDQTYGFLPHPQYYWLSGSRRSGCVMAYDSREGWTHFVRPIDEGEILWEGSPEAPEGRNVSELDSWIQKHSDRKIISIGSAPRALTKEAAKIYEILDDVRRSKDEEEIALIRKSVKAAVAGFKKIRKLITSENCHLSNYTERFIQIELESEMMLHGAHTTSFDTIVAAGTHAAVLHFAPTDRVINREDLVMIDAGAAIDDYACDVTRTYAAGGKFTTERKAVYDLVLKAQKAVMSTAKAGVEWYDVHLKAASVIAEGLVELGIMQGSVDGLVESGAVGLFLPHGIGHMLGLRVRDVGGKLKGRENNLYGGAAIRVDMPLRENFVMTDEPGIYFIEPILNDPSRREKYGNSIKWDELKKWMHVGGVRIEDDLLITRDGNEVLTADILK